MYLDRDFWRPDDERLEAGTLQLPATSGVGSSGGAAGPGVASAGAPTSDEGAGQPAALRSFFALNRDQGAQVLGGLADSLNRRIASTSAGLSTTPGYGPEIPLVDMKTPIGGQEPVDQLNAMITAYNEKQRANAASAKDITGRNQAAAQALGSDVGRLGTPEGQQSLLEQQYGSTNYTPGQARLDAWLTGAAANARPDLIGGVQRAYGQLGQAAGATNQLPFGQAMYQFGEEQRRQLHEQLLRKVRAGALGV